MRRRHPSAAEPTAAPGVGEPAGSAADSDDRRESGTEHGRLLVQAARAEAQPRPAEAAVDAQGIEAVAGLRGRGSEARLEHLAAFGGDGQADPAELTAHAQGARGVAVEAHPAHRVASDQEGVPILAGEAPLEGLAALDKPIATAMRGPRRLIADPDRTRALRRPRR